MRIALEIAHAALFPGRLPERTEFNRACLVGREVRELLASRGYQVEVALLVDDKRLPDSEASTEGTEMLVAWASEFVHVDYWTSERRLAAYRPALLELLRSAPVRDDRATELEQYVARQGHLPCSADIAIWHLLRLGKIHDEHHVMRTTLADSAGRDETSAASLVASILPDHVSRHEQAADRSYIRHIDGRLLPLIHRLYIPASLDLADATLRDRQQSFVAKVDKRAIEIGAQAYMDQPTIERIGVST